MSEDQALQKIEKPESQSVVASIIKTLLSACFGLALVVGTFFLEGYLTQVDQVHGVSSDLFVRVDETVENDAVVIAGDDETVFSLSEGRIWSDLTLSNDFYEIIVLDKVVIIPNGAVFDLNVNDGRVELAVFDGNVYVEFYEKIDNEKYLNSMVVPRDTQISFSISKVNSKISTLLYSKLAKEFRHTAISSTHRKSEWVKENQKKDADIYKQKKEDVISEVTYGGTSVDDGFVSEFVYWSEENLSFFDGKKEKVMYSHLFSYLDDAIYFATVGENDSRDVMLMDFTNYLSGLDSSVYENHGFYAMLDEYYEKLAVFSPADSQYVVMKKLYEIDFNFGNEEKVLNMLWGDLYRAMGENSVLADEQMDYLYGYLDKTLDGHDAYSQKYLTYQNQLFDNLFMRYSIYYKDNYFAIKGVLEDKLLKTYPEGKIRNEISQDMISAKLKYIKRLITFFFDDEISSVNQARSILARLVEEVHEFMPVGNSNVAVFELFDSQLKDIGDFWGYLNSPEYNSSKSYGILHEDRYEVYLDEKETIWSFVNIQEDIFGDDVVEISVNDVEVEIRELLERESELSQLKISKIESVGQRYVDIDGVLSGYEFSAIFDRDRALLSEVYSYGELIVEAEVKISGLVSLLKDRFVNDDIGEDDEGDREASSHSQRVAMRYVVNLVKDAGFEVEESDVILVNSDKRMYRVTSVFVSDKPGTKVTFDYGAFDELAYSVYLDMDGTPVVLDDSYSLDDLHDVIVGGVEEVLEKGTTKGVSR